MISTTNKITSNLENEIKLAILKKAALLEKGEFKKEANVAVTGVESVVFRCKKIEGALNSNFSSSAIEKIQINQGRRMVGDEAAIESGYYQPTF